MVTWADWGEWKIPPETLSCVQTRPDQARWTPLTASQHLGLDGNFLLTEMTPVVVTMWWLHHSILDAWQYQLPRCVTCTLGELFFFLVIESSQYPHLHFLESGRGKGVGIKYRHKLYIMLASSALTKTISADSVHFFWTDLEWTLIVSKQTQP